MGEKNTAIVAIGANLPSTAGSVDDAVHAAIHILHGVTNVSISSASRYWRTPAYPPGAGPDYCNAVVLVKTTLDPQRLLETLHRIEAKFGRDRSSGRWSSRVLDLDLIAYGGWIAPDNVTLRAWMDLPPDRQTAEAPDRMILPHPRMQDRGFVLGPLAEIAPDWCHPLTGRSVREMLAGLGADGLADMQPMTLSESRTGS